MRFSSLPLICVSVSAKRVARRRPGSLGFNIIWVHMAMGRDPRNPDIAGYEQQRRGPAYAYAPSDQRLFIKLLQTDMISNRSSIIHSSNHLKCMFV